MMMPGVAPLGGALADDPHMELPPVLMALNSPPNVCSPPKLRAASALMAES
jgi:hypothetical protein